MKLDNRRQITETCCSLFCMLIQIYCAASYDIRCPSAVARLIRSSSQCRQPNNYTCLLDTVEEAFTESCNGPRPEMEGFKTTMNRNNFDRIRCSPMRYQPFTFMTTVTSDCVYQKSGCAEEGQRFYDPDDQSSFSDHKCVCDYTIGYAFVNKTRHGKCFCVPFEEDCSCYKMLCESDEQLTSEFKCSRKIQIDEDMDRSPCLKMKPIQETSQGINGIHGINYITWNLNVDGYASAASGAVLLILFIIIGLLIILALYDQLKEFIKQRKNRQNRQKGQTNLKYSNQIDVDFITKSSQNVHHELEQISNIYGCSNSNGSDEKISVNNKEESNQEPYYTDNPAPLNFHKDPEIEALQNTKDVEKPYNKDELHNQPVVLNQKAELTAENIDTNINNEICTENQSTDSYSGECAGGEVLNHIKNKPESADEQIFDNDGNGIVNSSQKGMLSTVMDYAKYFVNVVTRSGLKPPLDDGKNNNELHVISIPNREKESKSPSKDTDPESFIVNTEQVDTITETYIENSVDGRGQSSNHEKINNADHLPDNFLKISNETELNNEANTGNHSNHSTELSSDNKPTETSENIPKDKLSYTDRKVRGQTETNKDFPDPKEET